MSISREFGAVRRPAAAGRFYAAEPVELRSEVGALLRSAARLASEGTRESGQSVSPKALIVPHAGYMYSGPIAASAYAQWEADRAVIRKVVLLGPAHFVSLPGMVIPSAEAFETPLGIVPIDADAVRLLREGGHVSVSDEAHAKEHSLEVQLPFLQVILDEFSIVPILVGDVPPDAVATVLEAVWGGDETRMLISSDLSHYYDYDCACRLDGATAQAIETLRADALTQESACGLLGIKGMLQVALRRHLRPRTLDLRNSGDTSGPRSRVVGYGAFAFAG